ncbi:GyrI-like domain-containing protein [Metabacillus litoralis]|uniref:GyrI-like domain-containing protein n=1 Tax=Metabacillus litoralis TaxID=152268 RepID=UPI002041EA68|nr:GyrI-like domain-containing protein [Metabacillus litoralis]MCM3651588.1 GyrI-like domain-containing protein [Metabacillus litoralis]
MKYEWRKKDKEIYLPKSKPTMIEVPKTKFFTLKGKGNPNSEAFKEHIKTLYTLSYTIRMMPKKGITPEGYFEYTVFPLEGVWDLDEEGRRLENLDKDRLVYKLMIRQPDFVTDGLFWQAKSTAAKKVAEDHLNAVQLEKIEEGLCVQCMHVGSYDSEPKTFSLMDEFCDENNLIRIDKRHREIYLNDARKTPSEKLKTVLRYKVLDRE